MNKENVQENYRSGVSLTKRGENRQVSPDLRRQHRSGFTLIELLVVVLIIGILAAVAVPQYKKAVLKSRTTQMLVRVKAIHDGAEIYYMANGTYPSDIREVDLDVTGGAEIKNSENFTSGLPAAFYSDGTECIIIGGHYAACGKTSDSLFIRYTLDHVDTSHAGKISCCGKRNTMEELVCRSLAHKTARDWYNGNIDYNCYYLN